MKLVIDESPLNNAHEQRGIGVYTRSVIEALKNASTEYQIFTDDLTKNPIPGDATIVLYTYFDLFRRTLKLYSTHKVLVTVHDVIPLIYPKKYPLGFRGSYNFRFQKKAIQNVDGVITVSETSKKDIVRLLGVKSEKISVSYNAPQSSATKNNNFETKKILRRMKVPEKYVLYIGDVNYNKNIIRLVKACKIANVHLVIVGKQAASMDYDPKHIETQQLKLLHELYGNDPLVMRLGYLESDEFNAIREGATLYCQPSLYEGFGIPVVEAFQTGIPVVASRTQALVEIAGDAAHYVHPMDEHDIAEGIRDVMNDSKKRRQLIARGKQRLKKYSWDNHAKEILSACKRVSNESDQV